MSSPWSSVLTVSLTSICLFAVLLFVVGNFRIAESSGWQILFFHIWCSWGWGQGSYCVGSDSNRSYQILVYCYLSGPSCCWCSVSSQMVRVCFTLPYLLWLSDCLGWRSTLTLYCLGWMFSCICSCWVVQEYWNFAKGSFRSCSLGC